MNPFTSARRVDQEQGRRASLERRRALLGTMTCGRVHLNRAMGKSPMTIMLPRWRDERSQLRRPPAGPSEDFGFEKVGTGGRSMGVASPPKADSLGQQSRIDMGISAPRADLAYRSRAASRAGSPQRGPLRCRLAVLEHIKKPSEESLFSLIALLLAFLCLPLKATRPPRLPLLTALRCCLAIERAASGLKPSDG